MGSDVEAPKPSAPELRLREEQANILAMLRKELLPLNITGQKDIYNLIQKSLPSEAQRARDLTSIRSASGVATSKLLKDLGFAEQGGRLVSLGPSFLDIQRSRFKKLSDLYHGQLRGALSPKGVFSPALTQQLEREERDLRATLSQRLGSGYETSTAGIQSLAEFRDRKLALTEEFRRQASTELLRNLGITTTAEGGFRTSRLRELAGLPTIMSGRATSTVPYLQTLANMMKMGIPSMGEGAALAGSYTGPIGAYQQDRALQLEANKANAGLEDWAIALIALAGAASGGVAGAAGAGVAGAVAGAASGGATAAGGAMGVGRGGGGGGLGGTSGYDLSSLAGLFGRQSVPSQYQVYGQPYHPGALGTAAFLQ